MRAAPSAVEAFSDAARRSHPREYRERECSLHTRRSTARPHARPLRNVRALCSGSYESAALGVPIAQRNSARSPYALRRLHDRAARGIYCIPLPAYIMRLQPGVLTTFTSNGVPGTIDLHRFTVLYYRRTDSGLQLVGGGFVTVPLRHYTGTAAAAQLNGMLPTPLAHWHTIQNACSPPMMPRYYATFRIRGNTLDWTWPGADKFDRQGSSPKTPESDTHGRSSHQGP